MMRKNKIVAILALGALAAGCASMMAESEEQKAAKALAMMKTSFKDRGQAKIERLDQDEMQRLCSLAEQKPLPKEVAERLEKEQQALVKYPADGKLLGDWRQGERIAQSGAGKQFNDDPATPSGANCYACHQLSKAKKVRSLESDRPST